MGRLIRYDMSKVKDDAGMYLNARRFLGILNAAKYRLDEDLYKELRQKALEGHVDWAQNRLDEIMGKRRRL